MAPRGVGCTRGLADIATDGVAPGSTGPPGKEIGRTKGVHQYRCIFHPWMRRVVTVR